jgi:hypothetical protein
MDDAIPIRKLGGFGNQNLQAPACFFPLFCLIFIQDVFQCILKKSFSRKLKLAWVWYSEIELSKLNVAWKTLDIVSIKSSGRWRREKRLLTHAKAFAICMQTGICFPFVHARPVNWYNVSPLQKAISCELVCITNYSSESYWLAIFWINKCY